MGAAWISRPILGASAAAGTGVVWGRSSHRTTRRNDTGGTASTGHKTRVALQRVSPLSYQNMPYVFGKQMVPDDDVIFHRDSGVSWNDRIQPVTNEKSTDQHTLCLLNDTYCSTFVTIFL